MATADRWPLPAVRRSPFAVIHPPSAVLHPIAVRLPLGRMSIVIERVLLMAAKSHLQLLLLLLLFAERLSIWANGQPKRSHNYCYVNKERPCPEWSF